MKSALPSTAANYARRRRTRWSAVLGVLLGGAGAAGLIAWRIDRGARVDNSVRSDAVVVLGCAVWPDGEPSPALRARIDEGVRAWRETGSRYLLVTGGVGANPPTEAVVMRRIAEREGVPPDAIIDDTTAYTTEGSALMCGRIARRMGWKRVTLVSDPWHLPRARRMFADYGRLPDGGRLDVRQRPAFDSPAWTRRDSRVRWTLRETVALPVYRVKAAVRGIGGDA